MRIECQNRIRSQGHGIQTQNSLSGHLCSPLSYFCLFLLNDKDKTAGRERRDRKRDRSKVWINLDFSFTQDIRRLHSGFCYFFDGCCSKKYSLSKEKKFLRAQTFLFSLAPSLCGLCLSSCDGLT